jgi:PilZ domain-containing protein
VRLNRNPVLRLDESAATRRRHGRVRCGETKCTLGEVLDLSASGVRVLIRGRVRLKRDAVTPMILEMGDRTASVMARVVWVVKAGWFRHTAGLQFVDVTPDQRAKLAQLAQAAGNNEYIRDGLDRQARSA